MTETYKVSPTSVHHLSERKGIAVESKKNEMIIAYLDREDLDKIDIGKTVTIEGQISKRRSENGVLVTHIGNPVTLFPVLSLAKLVSAE